MFLISHLYVIINLIWAERLIITINQPKL